MCEQYYRNVVDYSFLDIAVNQFPIAGADGGDSGCSKQAPPYMGTLAIKTQYPVRMVKEVRAQPRPASMRN